MPDRTEPGDLTGELAVDIVVGVEDDDGTWTVGLRACGPDEWHRLFAQHLGELDQGDDDDGEDGHDAFHRALVAACVVWEQIDDAERVLVIPGDAASWPSSVAADVWAALVQAASRVSEPIDYEWAAERISRSPRLQLEMAVCQEYRIPLSVFRGWAPDDQAHALAYLAESRDRCPGCGVPSRVMLDPDGGRVSVRACEWCRELEETRSELDDSQRGHTHLSAYPAPGR
jgi:hypothetical protein